MKSHSWPWLTSLLVVAVTASLIYHPRILLDALKEGGPFKVLDAGSIPDTRFVYLAQGPDYKQLSVEEWCNVSETCDFVFLTYKTESPRASDIFRPNTTWTEGRNELLLEAAARAARLVDGYEYFIFLDDDAEFSLNPNWWTGDVEGKPDVCHSPSGISSPFGCFQWWLLFNRPVVATPQWSQLISEDMAVLTQNFDAMVNAFHRSTLSYLMPFDPIFDSESWWYSQIPMIYLSSLLIHNRRLVFPGVSIANAEHRPYPRASAWGGGYKSRTRLFNRIRESSSLHRDTFE